MSPPPPRLFARPLLGDVCKALGLAVLVAGALGLPLLLPPRWLTRVMMGYCGLALWLIAFISLRTWRLTRKRPDAPL